MNPPLKHALLAVAVALVLMGCNQQKGPDPKSEEQCAKCAIRLRMIDGAKQTWAEKHQKTTNDIPKLEDLSIYMRGDATCPSGGTYTITAVGETSSCSFPEHTAYYQKSMAAK